MRDTIGNAAEPGQGAWGPTSSRSHWGRCAAAMLAALALAVAPCAAAAPPTQHARPIIQVPLVQDVDGASDGRPPFLGSMRMRIGADGFVRDVSFVGGAPRDSARILSRARRWIWEPARDDLGATVEDQAMLRVSARPGARQIDRPDEALGDVLGEANYAEVGLADSTGGAWRRREVDPVLFAHTFAEWLSDPHAYEGEGPWHSHCLPVFDASVVFESPTRALRADLARGCAFMRVVTNERMLFVPYGKTRGSIEADLARIFGSAAPRRDSLPDHPAR